MSIATAITAAQGRVADCYTAISNKGGTLPATQNLANMPTAIGSIATGGTINSLTVTPTTSQQTITATGGVDGYSPITVNAVTSAIDANISAGNIKSGVSILGVSGSVTELVGETRSVSLTSSSGNTFTPTSGKNGITSITVTPNNEARSVTPSTSSQTLSVNSGYSGNGTISVSAVTSSIDNNITAGNIKKDVTILGVTGTYEGGSSGYTELPSYQVVNGTASRRSGALTGNEFSNITSIDSNALSYAFYQHSGLTGMLDLSSLTSVGSYGLNYAFFNCTGLTSVDLSSLTSVGFYGLYYAFDNCTGLNGQLNLSSLTSVLDNGLYRAFSSCSGLTGMLDLSSLTTIAFNGFYYAFRECTGLTSVDLSSLTSVGSSGFNYAFRGCTGLTDIYFNSLTTASFGSYTNQFNNMLSSTGTSVTHKLHFPSNLESTIQGMTGYPTFGGTSGYVVLSFDLPATS